MFAPSLLPPSLTKISSGPSVHAAGAEVVCGDLRAQPLVADVGAVALERLGARLLAGRGLERLHHRGRQRQRDVADAEVDDPGVRVRLAKGLRSAA